VRPIALRLPAVALLSVVLVGCASGDTTSQWTFAPVRSTPTVAEGPSPSPSPAEEPPAVAAQPEPVDEVPANGEVAGSIEVRGFDLGFDPATVEVPAPGVYQLTFQNDGAIFHDIVFDDGTILEADPGMTVDGEVAIPAGGQEFICSVPGHAQAGMVGRVVVAGAEPPTTATTDDGYVGANGGPATAEVQPDPNAPPPVVFDAAAPPLAEGDVHDIELVMTEEPMTVAPGFVQQVWTFGGTVPGPVIRVKVGDTVRVRLVNPPENEVPHSIDFHSSQVAYDRLMVSIAPGEELMYEWTADYAGVWMYHCGTAPALHHIANGMYGMVIVEPAEGLPPADREFAIVQSEWYLGPQGDLTSLEKAAAAAPAPDFVVFNGVANQYVDEPIAVQTGERVRMFVLNAGPSVDSSFHIVGTIFDTVIKEGVALLRGNEGNWGAQAVDLAPAQGAIVEFETAEDGLYPMVTHAFNFVGRGALGIVRSGDVEAAGGTDH
jgi:nitrite reductase (NO-forming)